MCFIFLTELPGWPLLSPLKVQMQKCEKCAREFCSVINYRRHIRVHHRLKKLDKVFPIRITLSFDLELCACRLLNYVAILPFNCLFSH